MKNFVSATLRHTTGALVAIWMAGCASQGMNGNAAVGGTVTYGAASEVERADLTFVREEEKLARDTYATLGSQWSLQVFANIPQSESSHMAAILALLDAYGLPDPVTNAAANQFANPDLQALSQQLLQQGQTSLVGALRVGALIEEYDIVDIEVRRSHTTKQDIRDTYDRLLLGSRNHLRAFHSELVAQNAGYTPQYLSQAEYDAIVGSAHEAGAGH